MKELPELLGLATKTSSLVEELRQCMRCFQEGDRDRALEKLQHVEGEVDEWVAKLEGNGDSEPAPDDIASELRSVKDDLSWVRDQEAQSSQ